MSHKRKKEDPEELELPEFDEVSYMKKDMASTRAAIATIVLAIPFAIGSFALAVIGISPAGFLLGVVGMFSLTRLLPLVRIPTESFVRKDWISHAGTMFLSWLAVWILLMNPPFSDFTAPEISRVLVNEGVLTGDFINYNITWLNATRSAVWINATVSDNVAVREVSLSLEGGPDQPMLSGGDQVWRWSGARSSFATKNVCISAVDNGGHTATRCFTAAG